MRRAQTYKGKPCVKCDATLRYVSNNRCVACMRGADRERYQAVYVGNVGQRPIRRLSPVVAALRVARRARGLKQSELAAKLGYSLSTIENWERGAQAPSMAALTDWVEGLGMRLKVEELHD